MRELKLRAWTRLANTPPPGSMGMIYFGLLEDNQDLVEFDDPVMQYTGLKDKNGKDIYEGDVVRYVIEEDNKEEKRVDVVGWVSDDFYCGWNITESGFIGWVGAEKEVIGNIHENPELLNAKDN